MCKLTPELVLLHIDDHLSRSKAAKDHLHRIEVVDDVLIGKLLIISKHLLYLLILSHRAMHLLKYTHSHSLFFAALFLLFTEALHSSNQKLY